MSESSYVVRTRNTCAWESRSPVEKPLLIFLRLRKSKVVINQSTNSVSNEAGVLARCHGAVAKRTGSVHTSIGGETPSTVVVELARGC